MNEEEVKTKIVLPYLERLGLLRSDLRFEKAFSLQIGTNKVLVDGKKPKRNVVGGRLDTLVMRGEVNLLILELKEAGHALTEEDRDQAISYARLVHPIAPYAVVTNGETWQIFDTITKALLKPEDFKIRDTYRLALPESDREAALQFFLGYSSENLLHFCRAQVAEQMKPLVGSPQDLQKKFIPELTTPRSDLTEKLAAFELGTANGFLLLADSGIGKTTALCDYVQRRLAAGKPTVFFAGAVLENALLHAITAEFGWTFSEELSPVMLIRRINNLAKDSPVVVVVDAIDEWNYPQRAQSLVSLLRGSRDLRVKVVFSCKTVAWEGISRPHGSDIGFSPYLFSPGNADPHKDGYLLGALTDQEFFYAIDRYREVFGVKGRFEDKALQEARVNPFMLRVMFAVAADLGLEDITFTSRVFFEKYLDLLVRKCGDRSRARAQVTAVARLMFDCNEETVADEEMRRALSIPVSDALLPALFEQSILQQRGDRYAFSFQHLRSYLIAFKIFGWDRFRPSDLAEIKRDGVQGEALSFYLRYATDEQVKAVSGTIWDNAHKYIRQYADLVKRYVPQLDRVLVPGSGPELGFIAEYVVHRGVVGMYGIRRREASEPTVALVPVTEFLSRSNLLDMTGVQSLYHFGSCNGFLSFDITNEVLEHELFARVQDAIKRRQLSLVGSEILADEALVAAICSDRKVFASLWDSERNALRFPISVKEVRDAIVRAKLRFHFERTLTEKKRREGTLREVWSGQYVSYSRQITPDEESQIAAAIEEAMAHGNYPPMRGVLINLRDLEEALDRAGVFSDLERTVTQSPWRTGYSLSQEMLREPSNGADLVAQHVKQLFEEFFRVYRNVIDTNFPEVKGCFELRSQMPVRLFIEVRPNHEESRNEVRGTFVTVCERIAGGIENEVVLCAPGELKWKGKDGVCYRGEPLAGAYNISFDLEQKMYHIGSLLLTDMVYSRIAREWQTAGELLRCQIGGGNAPAVPDMTKKLIVR